MHLRRAGWIGLTLVVFAVVTFVSWTAWFRTRTWRPVNMPVSLSRGAHFNTGEFGVNLAAQYAIEINAKGGIPVDELGCLLGSDMRSTCSASPILRVRWILSSGGNIEQGISDDSKGGGAIYSTGEAIRTIGLFKGEKGRRYDLDIDVLADGSRLAIANPQLSVTAFDTRYESALVLSGVLRFVCAIIGLLGVVFLATSILSGRQRHRQTR